MQHLGWYPEDFVVRKVFWYEMLQLERSASFSSWQQWKPKVLVHRVPGRTHLPDDCTETIITHSVER